MTSHTTSPGFSLLVENLEQVGFFEFFLPWALILAVTYGVLQKTEVFDDDAVDATVAMVFSFLALFGVYSIVPQAFFAQTFGILTVVLVLILSVVIALGAGGVDITEMEDTTQNKIVIGTGFAVFAVALWFFRDILGIAPLIDSLTSPENMATFLMVTAIFVVLYLLFQNGD